LAAVDAASGRRFWHNRTTGTSQWVPPPAEEADLPLAPPPAGPAAPPAAAAGGAGAAPLAEPWIAVPREDWQAMFGTKAKAHKAKVKVTIKGKTVICWLGDTMPRKANIKNGAVIDLAPGAQAAFGLKPPFLVPASWEWA
jgi:hypothetical protein